MTCFWLLRREDGGWTRYGCTVTPSLALAWHQAGEDRLVEDESHGAFDEEELVELCQRVKAN